MRQGTACAGAYFDSIIVGGNLAQPVRDLLARARKRKQAQRG